MINPVLDAFANILPQIGFQTVKKKAVSLAGSVLVNKGLFINISMVGSLRGTILIGMDLDSAKRIAATMMMGMEVPEFNSMAQSAVSEMGNMVCANACSYYNQAGILGLEISPPTLLIGEGGQVKLAAPQVIVVKLAVDNDIEVDVYVGLTQ